jgi:hypothetical protein
MKIPKFGALPGLNRNPPPPPPNDYSDEVSDEQLEALRKLVDPDGTRAKHRRLLCEPGW